MRQRVVSTILVMLALVIHSSGQDTKNTAFQGNLPQALLLVSQTFHVSVLGELVDPVPANLTIQINKMDTARTMIVAIVRQCPGYMWLQKKGTFIVAQKQLYRDAANPMNQVIPNYQFPANLSIFRSLFPAVVDTAVKSPPGIGGIINGFGLPKDLSPSLTVQELHNQKARDILLRVSEEVGNLYCVLVFPSVPLPKPKRDESAFPAWEIAGGPGLPQYKSYLAGDLRNASR